MQDKLPHRKQLRLKEYDYSAEGYYFITICTQNRKPILGKIINNQNKLQMSVGADSISARKETINNKPNANIVGTDSISARKEKINIKPNANIVGADDPVRPNKIEEQIKLTHIGKYVEKCWKEINKIYTNIEIGDYVIMPNHIHGIIILNGRTESSAPTKDYTRI